METTHQPTLVETSERVKPSKTLRIYAHFGRGDSERLILHDLNIFAKLGIKIVTGGTFDETNPNEIGVFSREDEFHRTNRDRVLKVAQAAGVLDTMPKAYEDIEEIRDARLPFIAKFIRSHQGIGKLLIRTDDERDRFITVAFAKNLSLSLDKTRYGLFGSIKRGAEIFKAPHLKKLLKRVRQSRLDFKDSFNLKSTGFVAEEYIETPSEYYTSYRVVVDAFGTIYASELLRSENKKTDDTIIETPSEIYDPLLVSRNTEYGLLTHPKSPVYIRSPRIVSNGAQGGSGILLNGKPIPKENQIDREVAIAHGIDPDNPQIPKEIERMAKAVGIASRPDAPYVGVDFLQQGSGQNIKYRFLEVNAFPHLIPEYFPHLPKRATYIDAEREMLRRVALALAAR